MTIARNYSIIKLITNFGFEILQELPMVETIVIWRIPKRYIYVLMRYTCGTKNELLYQNEIIYAMKKDCSKSKRKSDALTYASAW